MRVVGFVGFGGGGGMGWRLRDVGGGVVEYLRGFWWGFYN
jgi:hypothetical protein